MADPFVFRYRNADPKKFRPIGDRYIVEMVAYDEEALPSGLFLPEGTEEQRGWHVGIVWTIGNGHRLDVPDVPVILDNDMLEDVELDPQLVHLSRNKKRELIHERLARATNPSGMNFGNTKQMAIRWQANVPMFFSLGEAIAVERYSGRQATAAGRVFKCVNQVDCLFSFGQFFRWDESVGWVERDLVAEEAAARAEQAAKQEAQAAAQRLIVPG
jgi:co-chaperonin GroES (HSP10)